MDFINRYLVLFVTSFFFYIGHSQVEIQGKISNIKGEPIPFVSVQLVRQITGNLESYTTTTAEGTFILNTKSVGKYSCKINHMSYEKTIKEFSVTEGALPIQLDVVLMEKSTFLKEVVLDFKPQLIKIQNDTITYNLDKLMVGNEKNLTDMIDKLPGVKMNKQGLITVNGKVVKKLLVDGEELLKNQHKTIADNLSSEMIEGIRFLRKYNDFGNIKGFANKQSAALDVSLKDEFKNKLISTLKVAYGYKNKGLVNTTNYRFGGKLKFVLLGNWNTIGEQSITSFQYNQLLGVSFIDEDQNGFSVDKFDDYPKFLEPTTDVLSRENTFGALSIIYKPNYKLKVSLQHIFSKTEQVQNYINERFFNDIDISQLETEAIKGSFLFNNTILELGYQPNSKMFMEYKGSFAPDQSEEGNNLINTSGLNTQSILQKNQMVKYKINQNVSLYNVLTRNTLLKSSVFYQKNNKKTDFTIDSNSLLNISNTNSIEQLQTKTQDIFGFKLQTITTTKKKYKIKFNQGILSTKANFENVNEFSSTIIKSDRVDSYTRFSFDSKLSKKLKYLVNAEYRYIYFKRFDEVFEKHFLSPLLQLDYKLNRKNNFNFEYKLSNDLPTNENLNTNTIVNNYFELQNQSEINKNAIFPKHHMEFLYTYNSRKGSSFSAYIAYDYLDKSIGLNTNVTDKGIVITNNNIVEGNNTYIANIDFEKRIRKGLSLYSDIGYSLSDNKNYIDNVINENKINSISSKIGVYSRYFKLNFNFDAGISFNFSNFKTTLTGINTNFKLLNPFFNINGKVFDKKLVWSVNTEFSNYRTDFEETNFLNVSPQFSYPLSDSFELSLTGSNILNIEKSEITSVFNTSNYFESSTFNTLQGYVLFGIQFSKN